MANMDGLAEALGGAIDEMKRDAARYRWLKSRLLGADFDWNGSGAFVIAFEMPHEARVSANCDRTIDDAMELTPNAKVTGSPALSASPCGLPGYAQEE